MPSKLNNGEYSVSEDTAVKLITRINDLTIRRPEIARDGLAIIYIAHEWSNTTRFESKFTTSAITKRVNIPHPVPEKGDEERHAANQLLTDLAAAAPPLLRAVDAISTELRTRLRRTPLLLPIRNFSSKYLSGTIERLSVEILLADKPHERLKQACSEIETNHPYSKSSGKKGFLDQREIFFGSPGRDLHAKVWKTHGNHNALCTLNSLFRLGGPIEKGFHYDCCRGSGLDGRFPNCHDSVDAYVGSPHLNIAPNDFIRT